MVKLLHMEYMGGHAMVKLLLMEYLGIPSMSLRHFLLIMSAVGCFKELFKTTNSIHD